MSKSDFNNTTFNQFLREQKLMASQCKTCGKLHLPPRPLCPACFHTEMDWTELSGKGNLVAFTTVHIAPTAMIEAGYGRDKPYCTGIVQLVEGPSISGQIVGVDVQHPEELRIGVPVELVFEAVSLSEEDGRPVRLTFRV